MRFDHEVLLPDEFDGLITILRRDIKSERSKATVCPDWETYHLRNVRVAVRLLEAFGFREDDCESQRRE